MGRQALTDRLIAKLAQSDPIVLRLKGKAVPKARPRMSAKGTVFTPARTKKFEDYVCSVASTVNAAPFTCPVKVTVRVDVAVPKSFNSAKRWLAINNYISPQVGDLDNKVKAITDAINGVLYIDDRQINELAAVQRYADNHGILVTVERNGCLLYTSPSPRDRQ